MNPHGAPHKWERIPTNEKGLWFYFETVFKPARLANASHSTRYQYEINLARLDAYLGRAAMLTDLNDETIGGLASWLEREHGLSAGSSEKLQDNVTSLWRFLFARRLVEVLPTLRKRRAPKTTPRAWNAAELQRLWDYLSRLPGSIDGVPASFWFLSLHSVMWDTGERVGAIMQTKWSDVDLAGGWILVRPETRKGGLSDKLSRLSPASIALLEKALAPRREVVWPWPYHATYLHKVYGDLLIRAGLTGHERVGFHRMRKSVASFVKLAGGNASSVLGHFDPRQTETYLDPRICPQEHAADVLPPIHKLADWQKGKRNAS